jgi:hypothetical protein
LLTRIIFWLTKRRIGRVPLGLRVRARDPKLFRQIVRMDLYAVSQGAIPVRLLRNQFSERELVELSATISWEITASTAPSLLPPKASPKANSVPRPSTSRNLDLTSKLFRVLCSPE